MKKILFILFLFFQSFSIYSQSVANVYKVYSGPWNSYKDDFDITVNMTRMMIIFDEPIIRINDLAHSVYITRDPKLEDSDEYFDIYSWDAIDERSRDCKILFALNKKTNEKTLSIVYNYYIFQYYYE